MLPVPAAPPHQVHDGERPSDVVLRVPTPDGRSTPKYKANYQSVKDQFGSQNSYAEATKSLRAKYSVEPSGIKTGFTTEFKPNKELWFPEWCVAGLISWDGSVIGCRGGPYGGLKRIKTSRDHVFAPNQGFMKTKFDGGRPKIPGFNKSRAWWGIRICLCKGAVHKPPPSDWKDHLDEKCTPVYGDDEKDGESGIPWTTTCPLNMYSCIQDLLAPEDRGRTYPAWSRPSRRFGKRDLGKTRLIPEAQKWWDVQGGNPDGLTFCSNSGRKSTGKWCAELCIPYRESFPLHGDLWDTWSGFYQPTLVKEPGYQEREQPKDIEECTRALWKLARWIGRGRESRDDPSDFTSDQIGRMLVATLRSLGQSQEVARILDK